jgi:para-aminobenzoate synthetase component 1
MRHIQSPGGVLELHSAADAFETLEDWLRSQGFFAERGASLVADVFLSYGLSESIRRDRAPGPPEPCTALPQLYACVRDARDGEREPRPCPEPTFEIGNWARSWSDTDYGRAVEAVRHAIRRGDVYQANIVQHLSAPFAGPPNALASRLEALPQPREWPLADPAWRVLETPDWAIVSASPELFLARRADRVWTMPIKGTRPAGWATELHASGKDAAEHVMIVDLERNDLSRVCVAGTVRWPQLMATEPLAGVEHMVSLVEGRLRPGVGLAELLGATFPGGSITGAPKIAAVDLIAALEPAGRGASMGALGRIHGNGDVELALTIRTFAIAKGRIHLWVGGGIVWDSDPLDEIAESFTKARPLLEAIGAPFRPDVPVGLSDSRPRVEAGAVPDRDGSPDASGS